MFSRFGYLNDKVGLIIRRFVFVHFQEQCERTNAHCFSHCHYVHIVIILCI